MDWETLYSRTSILLMQMEHKILLTKSDFNKIK